MSGKIKATGHCLCGAVSFTAKLSSFHADACHCAMCQRWGGGPFIRVQSTVNDLHIVGEEKLSFFQSSEWAERVFCSCCGSHIFYHFKPTGQIGIPVGLLDNHSELNFRTEIFFDEKSALYDFANPTKKLTGADVMALFAATQQNKRQQRRKGSDSK